MLAFEHYGNSPDTRVRPVSMRSYVRRVPETRTFHWSAVQCFTAYAAFRETIANKI